MVTKNDISHQCCRSALAEIKTSEVKTLSSGSVQNTKNESTAALSSRKTHKSVLLNGSLIAAWIIGITVICVGLAALALIDGSATIDRPTTFLSRLPLTFLLILSTVIGTGIIYLMVQALLAITDDFDFKDHR